MSSPHALKIFSTTLAKKKNSQARLAAFSRRLSRQKAGRFWKQCPKTTVCLALIASLPNQRTLGKTSSQFNVIGSYIRSYPLEPSIAASSPSSTRPAVIIFGCHFKTTSPGRFSLCESSYPLLCQISSHFTARSRYNGNVRALDTLARVSFNSNKYTPRKAGHSVCLAGSRRMLLVAVTPPHRLELDPQKRSLTIDCISAYRMLS